MLLGACLIVVAGAYGVLRGSAPATAPQSGLVGPSGDISTPAVVTASPSAAPARTDPTPNRLLIPRISVDAQIEARGLDANRNMATADDFHHVAWYNLGPAPGQPGNALINGHVSWWTGTAVFTRLWELHTGDEVIVVRGDGTRAAFKVTEERTVAAGARVASLFAPSRAATLTLITCTGLWNPFTGSDTERLLVSAVLE